MTIEDIVSWLESEERLAITRHEQVCIDVKNDDRWENVINETHENARMYEIQRILAHIRKEIYAEKP